jgi:ubiquinone/menaquinone biosynthesis C-methylase UbiE
MQHSIAVQGRAETAPSAEDRSRRCTGDGNEPQRAVSSTPPPSETNSPGHYTPALGNRALTPLYDLAIAGFTRERHWRSLLVRQVAPGPGDRIVDVGCGTGTLTRALKQAAPEAEIIGIDPDPEVLQRAHAAAAKAGRDIPYREGFFDAAFIDERRPFTKVVSSLVLHQVPLDGKKEILETAYHALVRGGEIHIADYGLQRTPLMRFLFRNVVQRIDGVEDTEPNGRGVLPELMRAAGFEEVDETHGVPTVTGSISIYRGLRRR